MVGIWTLIVFAAPTTASGYDAAWAGSLRPRVVTRLPVGTYAGPWHLGSGVHLVADSGAVLEARQSGAPALVIEGSDVTIEGLTIRPAAGATGIEAAGCVRLRLLDVRIVGGARGLEVHGGDVSWSNGSVEGTTNYGVWAKGARLSLRAVKLVDIEGPALYLTDTQAEVFRCGFASSEYGILALRSQVEIGESNFAKLRRVGIALTRSSGRLARNRFSGPFFESAISVLAAPSLRVEGNRIEHAGSAGIKLLDTTASLEDNVMSGARSDTGGLEGNGLYLFASHVDSHGDTLRDNDGTGITVIGGVATLTKCQVEGAGQAAGDVASHGVLVLSHCDVRGGSTEVVVEAGSVLKTDDTRFEGAAGMPDAGGRPTKSSVE